MKNLNRKKAIDEDRGIPIWLKLVILFLYMIEFVDLSFLQKDFFKPKPTKQRNVIIAITIVGLLLLGVVIGTVVGVVMSQKCE